MRQRPDDPDVLAADVVVLAHGDPLPAQLLPDLARAIDRADLTIAADGGLGHAARAGREVDVLVGDLDSVDPEALARARSSGCEVIVHPRDKDATDLDLALSLVVERWRTPRPPTVLVVGGHGGRTDHALGNLLLLSADRYAQLRISAWLGTDVAHVVRDSTTLVRAWGPTVSLLAMHGPVTGVHTEGLRFPLADATLAPGSSLGLSNTMLTDRASVTVRSGVLLVVQSATD